MHEGRIRQDIKHQLRRKLALPDSLPGVLLSLKMLKQPAQNNTVEYKDCPHRCLSAKNVHAVPGWGVRVAVTLRERVAPTRSTQTSTLSSSSATDCIICCRETVTAAIKKWEARRFNMG